MKKRALSGLMVGILIMTNGVCAFAAEGTVNQDAQSNKLFNTVGQVVEMIGHEGTVDLDQYMQGKGLNGKEVIYGEKPSQTRGRPSKPNADSGYFWVEWGADRFTGYFDHSYKMHQVSVTNKNDTLYSDWQSSGTLAQKTIKASVSGNKANWKTK